MTHPRVPLTFPDAVSKVIGRIGSVDAARVAGISVDGLAKWSNPTNTALPRINQALALDNAYRDAGGEDAPFLDAFAFQLDVQGTEQRACRHALLKEIATVSLELGQALAAALTLAQSNASPLDAMRAFAEAKDAVDALDALQRRLACFLPSDAGSDAGNMGGAQ